MFDDIRPYRDEEVNEVIFRLIANPDFIGVVASYSMPKLYQIAPKIAAMLTRIYLKRRAKGFSCVHSMQQEVSKYLNKLIKQSTDGFSYSGLEKLDLGKPTLFIGNHRDIALDPALVNFALFKQGSKSAEIAIGDNLLTMPWVSELMRLNKSFIVKRSETNKRAILEASKNLSAYIHHTLTENKHHIWIAQREGRAKDGLDKTNPAVVSMLLLNKPKSMNIGDYLQQLNIVPVATAYEFDPCDQDKARELAHIEAHGHYQKAEHEDIRSITQGLTGYKGKVHVAFGSPLKGDFEDSKAVARAIDEQIIQNYQLYDSNHQAHQHQPDQPLPKVLVERAKNLQPQQISWLVKMYANPVLAKALQAKATDQTLPTKQE